MKAMSVKTSRRRITTNNKIAKGLKVLK